MIDNVKEKYSVGALLYSPALNSKVAGRVTGGDLGSRYSLALCLEDTISPDLVTLAEKQVRDTLAQICTASREQEMYVPRIFVRVREPEQAERVFDIISPYQDIFTGFIFPKYTVANAAFYNEAIRKVNDRARRTVYMMPILESGDIVDFRTRAEMLGAIRDLIDHVKDLTLNVRVGGNDFSNEFAARRHVNETIYDILPIGQLLGDIITVFSRDYVVSGPVWEYFAGANDEWRTGLEKELRMDILNGFIGKTVIHPRQIPVVNEMLKVTERDYEDARAILSWDESGLQVGKSSGGERMNEVRTNCNWAAKILLLAEIYGIRQEHV
ncbi:HpcH/HpaI aldolase/citrate lyase family protein [Succinimonas amylolytica]|uniref:HpcH/HpaI aldolase/citrate lyase family protein n=1 Tax=Succinimonas amylolytica TaxID=83769 RepID=UPI000381188B|nr:HpcH/HpaI aldolase/citrate lyase family protein [Succinimonas amylolytica]